MRWLDPNKPVRKQMRSSLHSSSSSSVASSSASAAAHARFHQAPTLYFRVKFYVNGERERERESKRSEAMQSRKKNED